MALGRGCEFIRKINDLRANEFAPTTFYPSFRPATLLLWIVNALAACELRLSFFRSAILIFKQATL